ncbi:hypothetical protein ETB97_012404 [Aspergillus alliaceus]|uniref:Hydrophobin n=1 Tax=Petromyces alliaceus TaxID=209559 RepID=A0A5N6FFB7_PETAA|nr:fungal hydrophobin [Aspergillus alliaceus]KAB8228631.1 fungal hydrophobin [Aspergillus alliaceus]KAE8385814.1 fungal hydrophobin [Aspergillus alliaceus]KAF5861853.1 hypothetical protein ETB97_012404 [Aspergillus burnettii]
MQFSIAAVLALATAVAAGALPPAGVNSGTGAGEKVGNNDIRFPVPDSVTTKQASDKCGDSAQLSCCNKVTYAGDTTDVDEGLLAGALSNLIGAGSGSQGIGLFDECSKIDIPIINLVNVQDLLNKKCQQNIACCQRTESSADGSLIGVALPCIALGALL